MPSEPLTDKPVGRHARDDVFSAGKIAFIVEAKINMREMAGWSAERIDALFRGIALVERAMAGLPAPATDE